VSDSDAALLVVDDIEDNRFALTRRLAGQGLRNESRRNKSTRFVQSCALRRPENGPIEAVSTRLLPPIPSSDPYQSISSLMIHLIGPMVRTNSWRSGLN